MFQVMGLKVSFLSRHLSLRNVIDYVTEENLYQYILRCFEEMKNSGIGNPRLAVASLNPQSGNTVYLVMKMIPKSDRPLNVPEWMGLMLPV